MKKALSQYHIQARNDYSEKRQEALKEEEKKRIDARSLVKTVQKEKDHRIIQQR